MTDNAAKYYELLLKSNKYLIYLNMEKNFLSIELLHNV